VKHFAGSAGSKRNSEMTSDAKIGLLLGLAFIALIAFVINGLPDIFKEADGASLVTNSITNSNNTTLVLGQKAGKAVEAIRMIEERRQIIPEPKPERNVRVAEAAEVRYRVALPFGRQGSTKRNTDRRAAIGPGSDRTHSYVVQSGDNLAVIAKRFYGPEWGNKIAIVNKIYEYNRGVLSSPDKTVIGMKLSIPSLSSVGITSKTQSSQSNGGVFSKVKEAIGNVIGSTKQAEYIVRSGDNLWAISERYLGGGENYHDILMANEDVINDAEDLTIGMRLKLPRH
jgi:nucleoid-associated protein YgaU